VYTCCLQRCAPYPNYENRASPYYDGGIGWGSGHRVQLVDFSPSQLEFFKSVAEKITDAELRARIGDVVWIRTRAFRAAISAVDAYLESAKTLFDPEQWVACYRRIERALQLASEAN
jgi:hypothetical protein